MCDEREVCLSGVRSCVAVLFACGFVLLLEVFRVRFARVSCPRLRFGYMHMYMCTCVLSRC